MMVVVKCCSFRLFQIVNQLSILNAFMNIWLPAIFALQLFPAWLRASDVMEAENRTRSANKLTFPHIFGSVNALTYFCLPAGSPAWEYNITGKPFKLAHWSSSSKSKERKKSITHFEMLSGVTVNTKKKRDYRTAAVLLHYMFSFTSMVFWSPTGKRLLDNKRTKLSDRQQYKYLLLLCLAELKDSDSLRLTWSESKLASDDYRWQKEVGGDKQQRDYDCYYYLDAKDHS